MRSVLTISSLAGFLLVTGCAVTPAPKWAPPTQAELSHPLSLGECLALARHCDLRAAQWRARLESARAELTGAKALPNPTFLATWEDVGIKNAAGKSLGTFAYGFSYPVFFWWTRDGEIAGARSKLHAEEEGVRADRRQLDMDVGSACFALPAAERKEQVTTQLLAEARSALRLADESYKLGAVAGHDVALARVEVRQAEAELQDARDETRAQRLALAFALGADRPVPVHVQDTALTIPAEIDQATTASEGVPEALLVHALAEDPSYAQTKAARQAAEAELQLQYRLILPLSETQASAERKHAPDGMSGTFSFETPIPLLNWNQAGVKKAKAELLAAQAEEETARREVAAGLSEAWEAWRTARNRHRVFSEQITKDRAQLAGDARDLFTSGRIGYTELLQARREWRQAEMSAVESWRVSMISAWRVLCQLGYSETEPSDKKET